MEETTHSTPAEPKAVALAVVNLSSRYVQRIPAGHFQVVQQKFLSRFERDVEDKNAVVVPVYDTDRTVGPRPTGPRPCRRGRYKFIYDRAMEIYRSGGSRPQEEPLEIEEPELTEEELAASAAAAAAAEETPPAEPETESEPEPESSEEETEVEATEDPEEETPEEG